MEATEFSKELDKALRLCRAAAELKLPVEDMLEHVEGRLDTLWECGSGKEADAMVAEHRELQALRDIVSAVGEVAAIGSKLPAAETAPAELSCPLPANLRVAQ